VWTAITVVCNILTSPCDMPHAETVIIARTAERNEQNCRMAAANQMNQVYSEEHNFNIMCTDRPAQDVEDMLPKSGLGRLPRAH
jgi:hypothetical protein